MFKHIKPRKAFRQENFLIMGLAGCETKFFIRLSPALAGLPGTSRYETRRRPELQVFLPVSERQKAAALHDASRDPTAFDSRISVLECGGPPPLSAQSISWHDLKPRYNTSFSWAFLNSRQNVVLHPA
jgi:hypothetical protein